MTISRKAIEAAALADENWWAVENGNDDKVLSIEQFRQQPYYDESMKGQEAALTAALPYLLPPHRIAADEGLPTADDVRGILGPPPERGVR